VIFFSGMPRFGGNLSHPGCCMMRMDRMVFDPGPAGDRMAESATMINAELARFCELLVEADVNQEWLADGAPNVVQWLTARFGMEASFGRRLAKLARRLVDLPEISKRFATGELSLDAVELLADVATSDSELELLEETADADLGDIARIVSRTKPPTIEESAEERSTEWLSTQWDLRRRNMDIHGRLAGLDAELVEDRLVAAAQQIPRNPETGSHDDWGKRMADGLVEVCATDTDGNAPIPIMTIHADAETLTTEDEGVAEIGSGPVVGNETARMLGCDAEIETTLTRGGATVGVGRKTRQIPGWLRRQVDHRDHHCRFPGCGRTVFLQIHHVQSWAHGGTTDLDNLILLCWWHHIFIHEHRWHITRDVNRHFIFRKPDWTPYPPRPT
jgi:hypothetical protein